MPKWLLDGFAGEASYEVEIEIINQNGVALVISSNACYVDSYMNVDNVKFIKKLAKRNIKI